MAFVFHHIKYNEEENLKLFASRRMDRKLIVKNLANSQR